MAITVRRLIGATLTAPKGPPLALGRAFAPSVPALALPPNSPTNGSTPTPATPRFIAVNSGMEHAQVRDYERECTALWICRPAIG